MMVLLGVGLGVLLFVWAREWVGFWPAVDRADALHLRAKHPRALLAGDHGYRVHLFHVRHAVFHLAHEPRTAAGNVAGLVVFFALAAVSKYSAIVLAPIVDRAAGRRGLAGPVSRQRRPPAPIAVMHSAAWLAIWAVYGFRWAPETAGQWVYAFQDDALVQQVEPGLMRVVAWIDSLHLLPNAYSQGFLFGQAKSVRPEFFAGEFGQHGWWSYFPVAIAIKTPSRPWRWPPSASSSRYRGRRVLGGFGVFCVIAPLACFYSRR
jgi:hypothetical protein